MPGKNKPEKAETTIDLLTIGDCCIDLYMQVSDKSVTEDLSDANSPKVCFLHGSKVPVDSFGTNVAGNSVNVAVAAGKLGIKTAVYTETGDDENSTKINKELEKLGVNTSYVIRNEGSPTDVHTIIVFDGERTIFSYHARRNYTVRPWPKPKFIYYTSIGKGFEPFQKELLDYIKENPDIGIVFNPGTFQLKAGVKHINPFLAKTHILILNKEEAIYLTKETQSLENMHKILHSMGPNLTVITDGIRGASASDGTEYYSQGPYSDNRPVVDKTGAGDAFSSGFISAIIYGKSLQEALKWGSINAGSVIKVIGSTRGILTKEEMERTLKQI